MRIALVGPVSPQPGGIAHYTASLSEALASENAVFVLSFSRLYPKVFFSRKTQIDPTAAGPEVPVERSLDTLNPISWIQASNSIRHFRPDAVLFQWWHPFLALHYAFLSGWIPSRVTKLFFCHNVFSHEASSSSIRSLLETCLVRLAFAQVDGFLAHAEATIGQIRQVRSGVPQRKVYHPLNHKLDSVAPAPDDLTVGEGRILFFGTVRRYKGLDVLIEALGLLRGRLDFSITVAGEFFVPLIEFEARAKALNLQSHIEWKPGYVESNEIADLFSRADLVVLPYLEATQSGVIPIAYAFGIPVIASRVGGISEVVIEGETGFLVDPGEASDLANRLQYFFQSADRDRLRVGIERFRSRLNWGQVVDNIQALVEEVERARC